MKNDLYKKSLAIIALFIFSANCAFAENPKDPYEKFNRTMFTFNDYVDRYVLKPIAEFYEKVMPKPLAKGFTNFYNNIDTIPTVINDVLQGNFYQATSDAWRFGINSTVGVLGFFDVAERMGLEPNTEDFGLTLARWGYSNSNYLVLPFIGPSTVRDAFALPFYYGMTIYPYIDSNWGWGLWGGSIIVRRADYLHYQELLQQISFDKYVFTRDAYFQHRNYLIDRNKELGDPYLNKNQLEEASAEANRDFLETKGEGTFTPITEPQVEEQTQPLVDG